METSELIKRLEQVKRYIYEHRMIDSNRILTWIINDLKLELKKEVLRNNIFPLPKGRGI
jgi:hypothetical protein